MPSKSKSEGRMTSRSRSRSRGRSKSPARGRSKSPGRPKGSKSKQSPSPARKSKSSSTKPAVTKTPTTPTRSSTRIKEIVEKEEVKKLEQDATEKKQGDTVQTSSKRVSKSQTTIITQSKGPSKYPQGGPFALTAAMLIMPAFVMSLTLFCNKTSCSIPYKKVPTVPTKLSAYYDRDAVLMFVGFYVFQAVLACVPVGKVVKGPAPKGGRSPVYRCNGLFALFVTVLVLAGLIYRGYPITIVYDKFVQLASTAVVFSCLLSICAFIRARKLRSGERNEIAYTGCTPVDFFHGRELHPRLGPIEFKQFLFRCCFIAWTIFITVFVWKAYKEGSYTHTLGLMAFMQGLMIMDAFIFEETISTSFQYRSIGLGFHLINLSVAMIPFVDSTFTRFLLEHKVVWHMGYLAAFFALYLIGYIIYRGSSSEKHRFRKDPHHPMFANFKKIPSPSGQKLLASGWWGLCRHPNHLGMLIMTLAWTLTLGCVNSSMLCLVMPMFVLFTIPESRKIADACEKKHGAAYDRYCRDVKYKLIPYVY